MISNISINLGNFLLSISDAIDLVNPNISSHQLRTAYIAWRLGKDYGLSDYDLEKLFFAALLHDIGALDPEDKIRLHENEQVDPLPHCIKGARLFASTALLKDSAGIVMNHHKEWIDWQNGDTDQDLRESQLLMLADILERFIDRKKYILFQDQDITATIIEASGKVLAPEIVSVFKELALREEFWLDIVSPRLYSILLHYGPFRQIDINIDTISSLSVIFRQVIDFRSFFTATHSAGVSACASMLADLFGLTPYEVTLMGIAGDLHDLGKLSIPNRILNKPGKLTSSEFAVIRQHTYFTYSVLKTIGDLSQIAEWAAFHHERLNGNGYPFHLGEEKLSTGARIMAVADMFTALAEDRPYRTGMNKEGVERILLDQSRRRYIDETITQLLLDNYEDIHEHVISTQQESMKYYKKNFITLDPALSFQEEISPWNS